MTASRFTLLLIFGLFFFSCSGIGIPVPATISGTFSASSLDDDFVYKGIFEKDVDSSGNWLLYGESVRHETELFGSFDEETVYDNGKQFVAIETSEHKVIESCVDSDQIPALGALKEAFASATKISMADIKADHVQCSADLYAFEFLGLDYLACVDFATLNYKVFGADFTAQLEGKAIELEAEKKLSAKKCKPTTHAPRPTTESSEQKWYFGTTEIAAEDKKACYFLHGAGVIPKNSAKRNATNLTGFPSKEYWGDIKKFTKQCSSHTFASLDTTFRGWNSAVLQQETCDVMANSINGGVVENAIIFSHSMGGMTLAAAIKNSVCRLAPTTSWYQSQSPFSGTEAAIYVNEGCKDALSAVSIVAAATGDYCNGREAYPVYKSLLPTTPGIKDLEPIAKAFTTGAQCGVDSWGLHTLYSPALALIDLLAGFSEKNDGMVPSVSSCECGCPFSSNYKDVNYLSNTNHADGTCRNGNGWWGNDRQPCEWFVNKL